MLVQKEEILSSLDNIYSFNQIEFKYGHENEAHNALKHYLMLTQFHYERCEKYKKIVDILGYNLAAMNSIESLPFIPVRLFKQHELMSVQSNEVVKTLLSSGTSGQSVSKIFLDRHNALNQTRALARITGTITGGKRMPMLIIDSSAVIKDRKMFSARGAGILGFSMLGHSVEFALDENMNLRMNAIENFLEKFSGQSVLVFGFTFIIWKHFYNALVQASKSLSMKNAILIHGGGWKKLYAESISNDEFKKALKLRCGINQVANYYGMVEQTGSIFMECEFGMLHNSIFNDIVIRRYHDFSQCNIGEEGIIQTLSTLPTSYPGHSVLTEDVGRMMGVNNCPCGRSGKYFEVFGRVASAEIRGCSDTYAQTS